MIKTEIIKSNCLVQRLESLAEMLRNGELVAFPTETVYGVGADIYSESAVRQIFAIKGRKYSNPMAAHISDFKHIDQLALAISPIAQKAIERFMPGPISIILRKKDSVPSIVTAGLDTIGIRFPDCPEALQIISAFGAPLAATSANLSGGDSAKDISPIIRDFSGKVSAIIDAGDSSIGVESTVVSFADAKPKVFRRGAISIEEIEDAIGEKVFPIAQ